MDCSATPSAYRAQRGGSAAPAAGAPGAVVLVDHTVRPRTIRFPAVAEPCCELSLRASGANYGDPAYLVAADGQLLPGFPERELVARGLLPCALSHANRGHGEEGRALFSPLRGGQVGAQPALEPRQSQTAQVAAAWHSAGAAPRQPGGGGADVRSAQLQLPTEAVPHAAQLLGERACANGRASPPGVAARSHVSEVARPQGRIQLAERASGCGRAPARAQQPHQMSNAHVASQMASLAPLPPGAPSHAMPAWGAARSCRAAEGSQGDRQDLGLAWYGAAQQQQQPSPGSVAKASPPWAAARWPLPAVPTGLLPDRLPGNAAPHLLQHAPFLANGSFGPPLSQWLAASNGASAGGVP